MSKYTTEVRFMCETLAGYIEQQGYGKIDEILTTAAPLIFDFDFPIFDEDYRLGLEKKILRHFYTREISEESVGLWKLRLDDRMNMIMPYYNQLYESELIEFNPLYDVDLTTNATTENEGSTTDNKVGNSTTNGETSSTTVYSGTDGKKTTYEEDNVTDSTRNSTSSDVGTSKDVEHSVDAYSDTPQGALTNVENLAYLTNARIIDDTRTGNTTNDNEFSRTDHTVSDTDGSKQEAETHDYTKQTDGTSKSVTDTTSDATGTSKSTEEYVQKIIGKRSLSSYSTYLNQFRETFLNIDKMVIEELNDLFFGLW